MLKARQTLTAEPSPSTYISPTVKTPNSRKTTPKSDPSSSISSNPLLLCLRTCIRCIRLLNPFKWKKLLTKKWSKIPENQKEIVLFILSNVIGTILFLLVFNVVVTPFVRQKMSYAPPERIFTISYIVSYLMSIIWQHALNLYLLPQQQQSDDGKVPSAGGFCTGLLQAYLVYGLSLICSSLLGSLLLKILRAGPGIVSLITLPVGGIMNFYLLKAFTNMKATTSTLSLRSKSAHSAIV